MYRELEARGLLDRIDLVSGVSGGAIAAAWLACHQADGGALDGLREVLRTRSIAVSSALGGLLDPFESRVEKLADAYGRSFFGERTLGDLADGPRLYVNATNLGTGNLFSFVTGRGGHGDIVAGEHELGFVAAEGFPLALAVAASSAFPPVFGPLRLGPDVYPVDGVEHVMLTDGGVYDNLGVNPLLRSANALDCLIVSDAGKPFDVDPNPGGSGAGVPGESIGILMEQVRGLQLARLEVVGERRAAWFSIDSAVGEGVEGGGATTRAREEAALASGIRTHLKRLDDVELDLLERHARGLLGERLDRYLPDLARAS